jgi:hypothetical protein
MLGRFDSRLVLQLLQRAGARVELTGTHGREGISEFDTARRLEAWAETPRRRCIDRRLYIKLRKIRELVYNGVSI